MLIATDSVLFASASSASRIEHHLQEPLLVVVAQGIACVTQRREPNGEESRYIYSFPESALPATVAERFKALFDHRMHWSFEELEPYIRYAACVHSIRGRYND